MKHEGMKIGALSEALGVTPRTIRFYEEEGLLRSSRSTGGTRYYGVHEEQRLRAILALAAAGIPLEQIRALASQRERHVTGHRASIAVETCLDALAAEVRARLDALHEALVELEEARALVSQCRGCRRRPDSTHCPDCPVREARDVQGLAGLIWDQD